MWPNFTRNDSTGQHRAACNICSASDIHYIGLQQHPLLEGLNSYNNKYSGAYLWFYLLIKFVLLTLRNRTDLLYSTKKTHRKRINKVSD